MSYTRSTWIKGDVISSARLNNMENGILTVSAKVDNLNHSGTDYTALETQSEDFVSKITQTEGQITVEHTKFKPTINNTIGNNAGPQQFSISVAGNASDTVYLTTAGAEAYGVTKLNSNTVANNELSNDSQFATTALGVKNAIEFLDTEVEDSDKNENATTLDAYRTLASLTEEDGIISATFQNIAITSSQITDRADGENGTANNGDMVVKTNASGIIPSQLLPSYVDDIIEYSDFAHFPQAPTDSTPDDGHEATGPETGKIYVDLSTGRQYRWSGSQYSETGVVHLDYNDDGNDGDNQSGAAATSYVSSVTQTDGQISVVHSAFSPSITWTNAQNGVNDNKPTLNITVAGNTGITAATPNIATTSLYGITKLYTGVDSTSEEMAATAKSVKDLKESIDNQFTNLTITPAKVVEDNKAINEWEDITSQCTVNTNVTDAQVLINRAFKVGFFHCKTPNNTPNDTALITLTPCGRLSYGQYFNGRMSNNVYMSAEIPEKKKAITQINSNGAASLQPFATSGFFKYRDPVSHTLTIKYLGTDTEIPDSVSTVEEYDNYSVASPAVTYFNVQDSNQAIVSGEMGTQDKLVTVNYVRKQHTLTAHYYLKDTTTSLYTDRIYSKAAGLSYVIMPVKIPYYTAIEDSIADYMPDEDDEKIFYYTKNIHTLRINYVDANDNQLAESHVEQVEALAEYEVESPTITGYTTQDTILSGTMLDENITVNVVYTAE